jgi:hypothetical protein
MAETQAHRASDATLNPPQDENSPSAPAAGPDAAGKLDIEKNAPASGAPSGPPAAAGPAFTFPGTLALILKDLRPPFLTILG